MTFLLVFLAVIVGVAVIFGLYKLGSYLYWHMEFWFHVYMVVIVAAVIGGIFQLAASFPAIMQAPL